MDEERKIITLTDEEGNEEDFELIDFTDYQDKTYALFSPYTGEEDDDEEGDVEVVIMEASMENDELGLNLVDDPALCNQILAAFAEQAAAFELEEEN